MRAKSPHAVWNNLVFVLKDKTWSAIIIAAVSAAVAMVLCNLM